MPKPISIAHTKEIRQELQDVVSKWDSKVGSFNKQKMQDFEDAVNNAIEKIDVASA